MRVMPFRPQTWAMSVAFDDQGDTVPKRGTTSSNSPAGALAWPPVGVDGP